MDDIYYKIWRSSVISRENVTNKDISHVEYSSASQNRRIAMSIFEECKGNGIKVITKGSEDYPKMLRYIPNAPEVIYVKGNIIKGRRCIGVVGSRKPSPYGLKCTSFFVRELIKHDHVIVSGMAVGIDQRAHEEALCGNGITYAVLGSGFDNIYPECNTALSEKIMANGALISEYPPHTRPNRWHFPLRNRIISGLCDALLLVEGKTNSGSIITAMHSIEQGREVFCVPGNIFSENSRGANALINDGAVLASHPSEITGYMENIVY